MNITLNANERLISPADPLLRYTGRIGMEDAEAPFFIFPCSNVQLRVTGRRLKVALTNHHSYFENRLGVIVNGEQSAVLLDQGEQVGQADRGRERRAALQAAGLLPRLSPAWIHCGCSG